jgi:hypothetical protein
MTEQSGSDARTPKVEAVQAVVDRVASWQDGATEDTVRDELRRGLSEVGAEVPDTFVEAVVARIRDDPEHFDVGPLLAQSESDR